MYETINKNVPVNNFNLVVLCDYVSISVIKCMHRLVRQVESFYGDNNFWKFLTSTFQLIVRLGFLYTTVAQNVRLDSCNKLLCCLFERDI
jgi:hypothetical protein